MDSIESHRLPLLELIFLGGLCQFFIAPPDSVAQEPSVRVPDGFTATLFANDDLAHDIYSMTIDSRGRVVVSGAGFIRTLIDTDGDGTADVAQTFADGPSTGAQGMAFLGDNLLCVGDGGLLLYQDRDADGTADGPPRSFLKLKTGSEHHAHAIRQGPDGWWYLIAGNFAGIDRSYVTLPTSPVAEPHAGVLMRLKPDLTGAEVISHGYRNAYDFDFHALGDAFTFDSDGERDVSLPWYVPTRVMQAVPGSHAGWFSRSWKRPEYFLDMPPVVGDFGRGSPTGVVAYRHRQFPAPFRDALFVLDWTFGRVIALPLERSGSVWKARPVPFMTARGQFGFAPTDVEVGSDGSLYVSIGGRGTQGGVFRVQYAANRGEKLTAEPATTERESVLNAPQPLSSWSRRMWMPVARRLGRDVFRAAASDEQLPPAQRLRAVEVLTELFGGVDAALLEQLAASRAAPVRARAVWSYSRSHLPELDLLAVRPLLKDPDALVVRSAVEALIGATPEVGWSPILSELGAAAGHSDRFVRHAVARVVQQLDNRTLMELFAAVRSSPRAIVTVTQAIADQSERNRSESIQVGLKVLQLDVPVALKLDALQLIRLGLGDVGPGAEKPAFEGYEARGDLSSRERELDAVRVRLAAIYPAQDNQMNRELERTFAMLKPSNYDLLQSLLARIDRDSHPVDDLHYLLVLARLPVERTATQTAAVAAALLDLDRKLQERQLKTDSNWEPRVRELYEQLVERDPALPAVLIHDSDFGRPDHVMFLAEIDAGQVQIAVERFIARVRAQSEYRVTNDVVFVLGESKTPAAIGMVREQYRNLAARNAVLMVLAREPEEVDRAWFLDCLQAAPFEVLEKVIPALVKLPPPQGEMAIRQNMELVRLLRRLGTASRELELREDVIRLLQAGSGKEFGFEFGKAGHRPQVEVIQSWDQWLAATYPKQVAEQLGAAGRQLAEIHDRISRFDFSTGDVERGKSVFEKRACARCHGSQQALGPDLAGVGRRFSKQDLFTAIVAPNRDVSPRYQTTVVETSQGKVFSGLIVYESVDGLILRNATNQTARIEAYEIEAQQKLSTSLMPEGLLKDATDQELIDLFAYIQSLK